MDIIVEEIEGELWVAATQKGRLHGLEIDPPGEEVRWGAIYWAKITRIDRALDAAFVSLGGKNEGILFNADIRFRNPDGTLYKGGGESIGKKLQSGQMIAVQAKSGYLRHDDSFDLFREEKNTKVSMDITLPGRFLIYAPFLDENQVSSRIREKNLRDQLMKMMASFPLKGLILRSSSEDTQSDILIREAKILQTNWQKIQEKLMGDKAIMVMQGSDSFQRTIGDQAGQTIDRIEISSAKRFTQIEEWCDILGPDLVPKITIAKLENPAEKLELFEHHGLLGDVEDLFQEYGLLVGGGSIIMQETAALTAIDVNRGGDERPAIDVNLEAANEIARQIRLRNIGGIILIDFLKLPKKAEQQKFLTALGPIFDTDPCTVQIHGLTALGLLELTRKRRTPPLSERLDTIHSLSIG